jgi:hypothetical protein
VSFPTREDFFRKFGDGTVIVIACRRPGSGPPGPPGTKRGYRCLICSLEVEATPAGQKYISDGGVPLCNPCAVSLAEKAEQQGRLGCITSTPEADASIRSGRAIDGERIDRLRKSHPWDGRS